MRTIEPTRDEKMNHIDRSMKLCLDFVKKLDLEQLTGDANYYMYKWLVLKAVPDSIFNLMYTEFMDGTVHINSVCSSMLKIGLDYLREEGIADQTYDYLMKRDYKIIKQVYPHGISYECSFSVSI